MDDGAGCGVNPTSFINAQGVQIMASDVAKSLRDRRLNAWNQAKEVLESAENRSMSAEETQKYDNAMAEVDTLDARLKTVLDSETRSREADQAYNDIAGRQVQNSGVEDARTAEIRAWAQGERGAPRAIEIARQTPGNLNLRTLGSASAAQTSGSNTVPTDFYDQLISYLVEVSGILQTGPTVIRTAGGETINIPVATSHVTAGGPILQTGAIPSADPVFSTVSLGASKFGVLVNVARELIDDTAVDLLGYLAMTAGRAIGNTFGSALVNGGSGISGGLLNSIPTANRVAAAASAVTANGVVAGGPSYGNLVALEYSIIAPYRQSRNAYWLAKDQTVAALRMLTDNNGRPIWEPSPQVGAPDMLLGKPIVADPFMPAVASAGAHAPVVFGDFSQYFVRLLGGLRFERSDDFQFGTDVVTFRAVLRGDGNLVDTHALNALVGPA
jgi:HK97 family phage major capsid protein